MTTTETPADPAVGTTDTSPDATAEGSDATTDPAEGVGRNADPEAPDAQAEEGEERGKAGREAAKYRTQLRAVEAERDVLVERVASLQRAHVERLAGALAQPGDLFDVARVEVSALLDEDGNVDPAAVQEAVAELLRARPGLRAVRGMRPDPSQGGGGGNVSRGASWGSVLSGGRRG